MDQAVKNSELWWGEEMSREVCKHSFFPFLKYQFLKGTKKIDTSKSPSIRAKVPCYDGKWAIELYDTSDKLIFPCENDRVTPPDFVPKLSQVACVLQCGGIWKGGKGWGVTWKVIQSVVKPREVVSVYGKCRVLLSEEDRGAIASQTIQDSDDVESETVFEKATTQAHDVEAEDSDEEQEDEELPEIVAAEVPEPVAPAPPKKKVVKKKVAPVEDTEDVAPAPKKKVVKKKKVVEAEV